MRYVTKEEANVKKVMRNIQEVNHHLNLSALSWTEAQTWWRRSWGKHCQASLHNCHHNVHDHNECTIVIHMFIIQICNYLGIVATVQLIFQYWPVCLYTFLFSGKLNKNWKSTPLILYILNLYIPIVLANLLTLFFVQGMKIMQVVELWQCWWWLVKRKEIICFATILVMLMKLVLGRFTVLTLCKLHVLRFQWHKSKCKMVKKIMYNAKCSNQMRKRVEANIWPIFMFSQDSCQFHHHQN